MSVALATAGMRVAIHYSASSREAEALARELAHAGHDCRIFQSDLLEHDAPDALIAEVTGYFGGLDVLVNSAAVMMRTPFGEVSSEEWDSVMALNVRAPFFLSQAAAPWLRARGGCIVNMADLAAFETWPDYIPHGISKAAIVQMTRSLARTLAPEVRVNAIAPGAVLLPEAWDAETRAHFERTTPLRRIGSPSDVADAVLYLVRAEYVTGETLIVDGGRHVRT